jgi:hypothetical protein
MPIFKQVSTTSKQGDKENYQNGSQNENVLGGRTMSGSFTLNPHQPTRAGLMPALLCDSTLAAKTCQLTKLWYPYHVASLKI